VPAEAVHDEEGKKVVWLPAPGRPDEKTSKPVTTGITDGKVIEIKDGLAEADAVLVPKIQSPEGETKSNPFMPFGQRRSGGGRPGR
jgi:hypothetical protein